MMREKGERVRMLNEEKRRREDSDPNRIGLYDGEKVRQFHN